MKNCAHCMHAEWKKTASGRMHPSGDGQCTYQVQIPKLPASKTWAGYGEPKACGGWINRREDLRTDCVYFAWNR